MFSRTTFNMARLFGLFLIFMVLSGCGAPSSESQPFWDVRNEQSQRTIDHSSWQELLDNYLDDDHESGVNRFDNESVSAPHKALLVSYLESLQAIDPRDLNSSEQLAYWINLYNSNTVYVVLQGVEEDNIDSIKDIWSNAITPGPWDIEGLTIAGQKISLNIIEHGILRPIWNDRRLHYALNCASIGCPSLLSTAFTADLVDELMDEAEEDFLGHSRAVSVDGGELVLSSLFDWYATDFAGSQEELLSYLQDYVDDDTFEGIESHTSVTYAYDWNLNKP